MGDLIAPASALTLGERASHDDEGVPRIIHIGNDRYITALWSKAAHITVSAPVTFVTILHFDKDVSLITAELLREKFEDFRESDDVFRDEFSEALLFVSANNELHLDDSANEYLKTTGIHHTQFHYGNNGPEPGPYYVYKEKLSPIRKLYNDDYGAFLHSVWQDNDGELHNLRISGHHTPAIALAVPSRMSHQTTAQHPLAGLRIAVKDNYKLRNIRMTMGNKAYYELNNSAPTKTAPCVEQLIQAGAVVVGTTKLVSFAATEDPIECVDYQAPWNPRADGYQIPAGSSSGSGAAAGAYPWIDITLGSDTSGSGRRPGIWNGCFAMRPTHGSLPSEGCIPSYSRYDVQAFFGRDLLQCKHFAKIWYGHNLQAPPISGKPAIIYPTDYMSLIGNQDQLDVLQRMVKDLESSLGVTHEKVSFEQVWHRNPPPAAKGMTFMEYMRDAARNAFFYDDYENYAEFRDKYFDRFGKRPYLSPPIHDQWNMAAQITKAERDEAEERIEVYREWFLEHVMKVDEQDAIIVLPIEEIFPRYRDAAPPKRFNPVGVPNLFLSPIIKGPELTVPIGHRLYESRVTGRTEKLPIAVSILGAPGRDLELFEITRDCLLKSGRPMTVKAGGDMF